MDRPTKPVGVTYAGEGLASANTEVVRKAVSAAATLKDLTEEYHFYSPALLHIGVRLAGIDPYADWLAERHVEVGRISIRFNKPIFKGMNLGKDLEWNYVLYGMPKEHWKTFNGFMGTLSFHDTDYGLLTRLRTQEIDIADPLYFEGVTILPATCPTVAVTVYALDTNKGCTYIRLGSHPLLNPPQVTRSQQSFDDTCIFAHELQTGDNPNPYGRIEQAQGPDVLEREIQERVRKARTKPDETDTESSPGGH